MFQELGMKYAHYAYADHIPLAYELRALPYC